MTDNSILERPRSVKATAAISFDKRVPSEASILVIEDDDTIAELVNLHLQASYSVSVANSGTTGYQMACDRDWSLILLDLRLPGKDGLEICRDLRAAGNNIPIIMLTSRSSELERVMGLELGADDYLAKPFSLIELEARVKAMLRRQSMERFAVTKEVSQKQLEEEAESGDSLSGLKKTDFVVDDIKLSERARTVTKAGIELQLTAREFELLAYFMKHPGEVFSRSHLLNCVWGRGFEGYEHTVNSHINRLRTKIETNPAEPQLIETVWGVGYKLNV